MLQRLREEWTAQILTGASAALFTLYSILGFVMQCGGFARASEPVWWTDREVLVKNIEPKNNAAVTTGQLKWISDRLYTELEALLPTDLGFQLVGENGFWAQAKLPYEDGAEEALKRNLSIAVLGQAKHVAASFYETLNNLSPEWVKSQLEQNGLTSAVLESAHKTNEGHYYPWSVSTQDDNNRAALNIGQLKFLFSLRIRADDEENPDGLPDLLEYALINMSDAQYAQYIGEPGAINPFSNLTSIDQIHVAKGGSHIAYQSVDGETEISGIPTTQVGLAAQDASLASLLNQHQSIGAVGGTFSAGSDGSANYSIPIELPAGTSGMVPSLHLSYSSHAGNGLLGVGFDIGGFQRITRGPASFHKDGFVDGVDFDLNDRFFLNGERLVCINGDYGVPGSEYRTEQDNFSRIFLKSDSGLHHDLYWEIETKSGTTVYLGKCNASCVSSIGESNTPIVWMVTRVEDRHGNYYVCGYHLNTIDGTARDYRPKFIRYTGNDRANLEPYVEVHFKYQERPDKTFGFIHGSKTENSSRLTGIDISTFDALNYSYELTYLDQTEDANGAPYRDSAGVLDTQKYVAEWQSIRSKLHSITRVSSTGDKLEPTVFHWNKPESGSRWVESTAWEVPQLRLYPSVPDLGWRWADMNSDGLIDLLRAYDPHNNGKAEHSFLLLNTGSGFVEQTDFQAPKPLARQDQKDPGTRLMDMNLDGILDVSGSVTAKKTEQVDPAIIWEFYDTGDGNELEMRNLLTNRKTWMYANSDDDRESDVSSYDYSEERSVPVYTLDGVKRYYAKYDDLANWMRSKGVAAPHYPTKEWFRSKLTGLTIEVDDLWGVSPATYIGQPSLWLSSDTSSSSLWAEQTALAAFPRAFTFPDYKPRGTEVHDFNGDGLYDIVESNWYHTNADTDVNTIFFMQKDGTFAKNEEYQLPEGVVKYPSVDARDKGVSWLEFGDINGDREIDLIQSVYDLSEPDVSKRLKAKTWIRSRHGNVGDAEYATGWEEKAEYALPVALFQTDGNATGARMLDVNGDGLLDVVQSTTIDVSHPNYLDYVDFEALATYTSLGFDRQLGSLGLFKTFFRNDVTGHIALFDTFNHPFKLHNGKYYHRVDITNYLTVSDYREETIYLNTGAGFIKAGEGAVADFSLPIALNYGAANQYHPRGYEYADFNGDGLEDFLETSFEVNADGSTALNVVHLNNGDGTWTQDETFRMPAGVRIALDYAGLKNGWEQIDFIDINGDGYLDLVDNIHTTDAKVYINQSKPEVITSITDGLGATIKAKYAYGHETFASSVNASLHTDVITEVNEETRNRVYVAPAITYAPSAPSLGKVKSSNGGYLLTSYAEEDGKGDFRWKHRQYGPRSVDVSNEASFGFAWVLEVDEQTGGHSIVKMTQDFPMQSNTLAEYSYAPTAAGHQLLSKTEHNYGYNVHFDSCNPVTKQGCGKVYHVYQRESTKTDYHPGSPGLVIATNHTSYLDQNGEPRIDPWGNVLGMKNTTTRPAETGMAESVVMETVNQYGDNEMYTRFGRLTNAMTTKTWTSDGVTNTRIKKACFTYNQDLILDSECAEPDDANAINKSYTFDIFGNTISETVTPKFDTSITARTTGTEFDQYGRFPVRKYFLDGSTKIYTTESRYDQQQALVLSTTDLLTNLTTTFQYDAWGTQLRTITPLGLETVNITRHASPTEQSPSGAQLSSDSAKVSYIEISKSTNTPATMLFYDAQGRKVLACTEGFNGKNIYTQTLYDDQGRAYKESLPYFSGDPMYWTTQVFDDFGRPYKVIAPDNTVEEVDLSVPYQTTQTNRDTASPKQRRTTLNLLGETTKVEDLQAGTEVVTSVQWLTPSTTDRTAVISKVTAPGNHTIVTKSDIFGNTISVNDPDKGLYSTTFNAYGETKTVTDSLGQVTESRYDHLGRVTETIRPEGRIAYLYDDSGTAAQGLSKRALYRTVQYNTDGDAVYDVITAFDKYGRAVKVTNNREGQITTVLTTYDTLGRVLTETDAGGMTVLHEYDARGFEVRLRDYHTGEVFYEPLVIDASGRVLEERLGGGITTTNQYRQTNGVMLSTQSVTAGKTHQHLQTDWDAVGNLKHREDKLQGIKETFAYDAAYRLISTTFNKAGSSNVVSNYTYTADNTGNILTMPQVAGSATATYLYADTSRPHQLTGIQADANGQNRHYVYNANGDLTHEYKGSDASGELRRQVTWTSFHKVDTLTSNATKKVVDEVGRVRWEDTATSVQFEYGPSNKRIKKYSASSHRKRTTRYYGNYEYEVEEATDPNTAEETVTTTRRHYIGGVALKETVERSNSTRGPPTITAQTKYFLKDHLGSTTVTLTKEADGWKELSRSSFDAWGRARNADGWVQSPTDQTLTNSQTNRGYTGHEMLDEVGLVHMNGRIYDAELGRFLSADPHVQAPENAQNYNRYSYVLNNPLSYTDPSGFFFKKLFRAIKSVFKAIVKAVKAYIKFRKKAARWVKENWRVVVSIAVAAFFAFAIVGINSIAASGFWSVSNSAWVNGALAGALTGAFNAAINGGDLSDVLKGAVIGGIQGGLTAGVLHDLAPGGELLKNALKGPLRNLVHAASHGVVGGLRNVAMGQKFRSGFLAAAVAAGISHSGLIGKFHKATDGVLDTFAGRTAIAAVVGGTVSEISGGDFANGAYTAAFQHLLNAEAGARLEKIRQEIAAKAKAYKDSKLWAKDVRKGDYDKGAWKCNVFACEVAIEAGARVWKPLSQISRRPWNAGYGKAGYPTASMWGSKIAAIRDWSVVANNLVQPGDIISARGHVGVVVGIGETAHQGGNPGLIKVNNHFWDKATKYTTLEKDVVVRRYIGK